MFDSIREWLSKWWTYLLLGLGVFVLLFRGRRTFQPQPPTVDTTKVTEATKKELDELDRKSVEEQRALEQRRVSELEGVVKAIDADTPKLLEDPDALNRYLHDTGKATRQ